MLVLHRPVETALHSRATGKETRLRILEDIPDVPAFTPPKHEPGSILPRLTLSEENDPDALAGGARITLHAIDITGNTVLEPKVLKGIADGFLDRPVAFADLEELRDELTLAYVSRGYVMSGAVVPDQSLADGVLDVRIVERKLTEIHIETDGRLRESYLRRQVERGVTVPVNVHDLEGALQILQQDARIRNVDAKLVPSERQGEARLEVRVAEARPWAVRMAGNNYNSPSIGSWRGELLLAHHNVTGFGDSLSVEFKGAEGLQDVQGRWEIPFAPFETRFEVHSRLTWSNVVESPFDELDINSRTETYGAGLTQPLYQTMQSLVEAFVVAEWRKSESFIFGNEPFSFSIGPINGTGQESVLRFGTNASYSTRERAIAARGVLSVGIDALNITKNPGKIPDGQFVSFLGQLQWARYLPWWGLQVVARADLQVSDRPLLGLEQFPMGGHSTVRGYRENTLVADDGVLGSLEVRVPVPIPSWRGWQPRIELVPFGDAGHAWNVDRPEPDRTMLASVGIGTRIGITDHARFQIFWGHRLKNVREVGESDLQDDGVQMEFSLGW